MNKKLIKFIPLFFLCIFLCSCSQVAITGRKQLNLVPDSVVNEMSFQSYSEFISQAKLSTNTSDVQLVKRVGARIQHAVE